MRVSYNRKEDIALVEMSPKKIDHAQEAGEVIIHFSKDDEPVLLEILDASRFLTEITKASMKAPAEKMIKVPA